MDGICFKVSLDSFNEELHLSSNQEEAGTKLLLHRRHARACNPGHCIIIRPPSADVDINVLFISIFQEEFNKTWIAYGTGEHRKILPLNIIDMDSEMKSALIGFHAPTGNDYVSSFFRHGKVKAWKVMLKHKRFVEMFYSSGSSWSLSNEDLEMLGVCMSFVWSKMQKH